MMSDSDRGWFRALSTFLPDTVAGKTSHNRFLVVTKAYRNNRVKLLVVKFLKNSSRLLLGALPA